MGANTKSTTTTNLNTVEPFRRTTVNRLFAAVYSSAILTLFYHHAQTLFHTNTNLITSLSLILSDVVLAFMWATTQSCRLYQVRRKEFPENLVKQPNYEFPNLDIFICTADPYKEPPIGVVNTALSVMAYDYPPEKISVYVSDDGGSSLTLFAFMEAAKFAKYWLPFCRENNVVDRNPEIFFGSGRNRSPESDKIKMMYEDMKFKVEHVLETGKVIEEYITSDQERQAFDKWTDGFVPQEHPTVIEILLDKTHDKDITDNYLPNLIYVSREKSRCSHHHFKAGALNTLLRVSAIMTNSPIILTLDCDMSSNDPETPIRALCYLSDPKLRPDLALVQFTQRFRGINKSDIYASEHKHLFELNLLGLDGLKGPNYVGTGAFFQRKALFGGPTNFISPENPELNPIHLVNNPIKSEFVLSLANRVASCEFEDQTNWGLEIGFRYGSLAEDYYTGYKLLCEGWRSLFCHPKRPAFYGDALTNLFDILNQQKRWAVGLLEVGISKYSPITFGVRKMGLLAGLSFAQIAFWAIWPIPITIYGFLPQLDLLNGVSIFPKVSEVWFFLYIFLFIGAYGQDLLEFIFEGGNFTKWWNDQRMWAIKGLTCFLFGLIEFLLHSLNISPFGFNVTNKVADDELRKRYEQEIFEFGVSSPMFVIITMTALLNLTSFSYGFVQIIRGVFDIQRVCMHMFLSGFVIVNCFPVYGAIFFRTDKGKMPIKVTLMASFLLVVLNVIFSLIFK